MLSLGTEVFLAFWIASTRVGLPARSAPPILAATSMFLISFANDLARRWSLTAFWCLVVAHLECPDMKPPSRSTAESPARSYRPPPSREASRRWPRCCPTPRDGGPLLGDGFRGEHEDDQRPGPQHAPDLRGGGEQQRGQRDTDECDERSDRQ